MDNNKKRIDLRKTEWREAIVKVAEAIEETELTTRALALLIADSSEVSLTQAKRVLQAIPKLKQRYLKSEPAP
ncbi:MAG: hypothetical protein WC261_12045 [Synergistaceae bacterium]